MKHFTFLIGSERSGSNFITSLMNGHPRICGPPPSHLFRLFATNRGNYGDLERDANWRTLVEDVAASFQCKLGHWSTEACAEELGRRARRRSVAELLRLLYEKEADYDGASHVFVKENHTYLFAPFLLAQFPGCRFVWLVRDPRDVASSWVSTPSIPGGVEKAIHVWLEDQAAASALYHQIRDAGRIVLVRYEDLVDDAPCTLRRLTDFLGLRYDERMLDFYNDRRTVENAGRIEAWANLRRPVMRGNTGGYRRVLSPTDQRYVELACSELMTRLGYRRELDCDVLDGEALDAELAALKPLINPGGYSIPTAKEKDVRDKRLAAIERVLARRL